MDIRQQVELPETPLPIAIIGAGGIVKDAHLPAYTLAGFPVIGIYDKDTSKALALKDRFSIVENVFESIEALIAHAAAHGAVFDLAIPADGIIDVLRVIPEGSAVLIQKPMGNTLPEAQAILNICNEKELKAAINFQLRFAPYMIAARQLMDEGLLGKVHDVEMMVCVYTPWHLWDFLFKVPRMEILYHSIHYLDLIRDLLGMPSRIHASTVKHPASPGLASSKTTMILDYHEFLQARIITNHGHDFGPEHQASYFKIEGTEGAIHIEVGLSLDYPRGKPSTFQYISKRSNKGWQKIPLIGDWFPHAFIGTMAELQNHVLQSKPMSHAVKTSYDTMRLVEAAYDANRRGGINLNEIT